MIRVNKTHPKYKNTKELFLKDDTIYNRIKKIKNIYLLEGYHTRGVSIWEHPSGEIEYDCILEKI